MSSQLAWGAHSPEVPPRPWDPHVRLLPVRGGPPWLRHLAETRPPPGSSHAQTSKRRPPLTRGWGSRRRGPAGGPQAQLPLTREDHEQSPRVPLRVSEAEVGQEGTGSPHPAPIPKRALRWSDAELPDSSLTWNVGSGHRRDPPPARCPHRKQRMSGGPDAHPLSQRTRPGPGSPHSTMETPVSGLAPCSPAPGAHSVPGQLQGPPTFCLTDSASTPLKRLGPSETLTLTGPRRKADRGVCPPRAGPVPRGPCPSGALPAVNMQSRGGELPTDPTTPRAAPSRQEPCPVSQCP